MSVYTMGKKPLILNSPENQDHFDTYAEQFTRQTYDVVNIISRRSITSNDTTCTSTSSSFAPRPSTQAFLQYRKKMNTRLHELNNTMSTLIKDSITGIDSICNKVRDCLSEMDSHHISKSVFESTLNETIEFEIEEVKPNCDILIKNVEENSKVVPFYTEINKNLESNENLDSHMEKLLPKERYSKSPQRKNILKKLRSFISNTDGFEVIMDTYVNNINKKIEQLSTSNTVVSASNIQIDKNVNELYHQKDFTNSKTLILNNEESNTNTFDSKTNQNEFNKIITNPDPKNNLLNDVTDSDFTQNCHQQTTETPSELIPLTPDVHRKKGTPDLNEKLQQQIEANDSFIGFQKLMSRSPIKKSEEVNESLQKENAKKNSSIKCKRSSRHSIKIKKSMNFFKKMPVVEKNKSKIKDLSNKYTGSLWFSQSKMSRSDLKKRTEKQGKNIGGKRKFSSEKNLIVNHNQTKVENKDKLKKSSRNSTSERSIKNLVEERKFGSVSSNLNKNKDYHGGCSCKIQIKNFDPTAPSTKCRLHWMRAKIAQQTRKKLDFCDILDELTIRDLEPIHAEYPRKDNQGTGEKKYNLKNSYLYKLMFNNQDMNAAWKNLLEPKQAIKTVEIKELLENEVENIESKDEENSNNLPKSQNTSKVLEKLLPYMTDPQRKKYPQSLIIMPVQVFYDNYNPRNNNLRGITTPPIPPKLPLTPIKETKAISKKSESPFPLIKPIQNSTIPKPAQTPYNIQNHTVRLKGQKMQLPKLEFKSNNQDNLNLEKYKNFTFTKPTDRKLWAHAFGKTTAQKLVKFIENQGPQHPAFASKHTIINKKNVNEPKKLPIKQLSKSLDSGSKKIVVSKLPTNRPILEKNPKKAREVSKNSNNTSKGFAATSASHQKIMLTHLQNLKNRNDIIQTNVQKAIQVIETKMIDILTGPSNSTSGEAFEAMEKEITNVLIMMKEKEKKTNIDNAKMSKMKTKQLKLYTNKEETMSDSLIKELENLLTSQKSFSPSSTSGTERSNKTEKFNDKQLNKRKRAGSDLKFLSSSFTTNTSSEEKFFITNCYGHSSKKSNIIISTEETKPEETIGKYTVTVEDLDDSMKEVEEISKIKSELSLLEEQFMNNTLYDQNNTTIISNEIMLQNSLENNPNKTVMSSSSEDESENCEEKNIIDSSKLQQMHEETSLYNDTCIAEEDQNAKNDPVLESSGSSASEGETKISEEKQNLETEYKRENEVKSSFNIILEEIEKKVQAFESSNYLTCDDSPKYSPQVMTQPIATNEECQTLEEISTLETPETEERTTSTFNIENKQEEKEVEACQFPSHLTLDETSKHLLVDSAEPILSEEVHKVLSRVEDVYSKLGDELMSSEEDEVSENREIGDINSGIFYTPFMQTLRQVWKNPDSVDSLKLATVQQSPSCYNVLNFLDTLTDINVEQPLEIHTTKMCYYTRLIFYPISYQEAKIIHWIKYLCSPIHLTESISQKKKHGRVRQRNKIVPSEQAYFPSRIEEKDSSEEEKVSTKKINKEDGFRQFKGSYSLETIKVINSSVKQNINNKNTNKQFFRLIKDTFNKPNLLRPINNVEIVSPKLSAEFIEMKCELTRKKYKLEQKEYELLLKSCYAVIFILMYTAFNMNIKYAF